MKVFAMLIRRELWEHRMLWITPLVIAALMLLSMAISGAIFRVEMPGLPPPDSIDARDNLLRLTILSIQLPFYIAAALLISIYLLDCLYTERRDRSVLFWKSLPLSDSAVVLSKISVGLVLVPLGFFLCAALTSLLGSALVRLHGGSLAMGMTWNFTDWLYTQGVILYGMVALVLWYAPFATYLLLVSAWARRSVIAWALIPPILLALLERLLLGTNYVGRVVQRGFSEVLALAFRLNRQLEVTIGDVVARPPPGVGPGRGPGPRFDPTDLLTSPLLWLGLAAAALMIWAAIALRRRGEDA
jgi:ABC-2 type transport system permease protein